jgi:magnesium transporter
MISRYTQKGITWLDVYKPTADELEKIKEEFLISSTVMSDLEQPSLKPSINKTDEYIYTVIHLPIKKRDSDRQYTEIDSILSHRWLITVRYDESVQYERFKKLADDFFSYQSVNEIDASFLLYKFCKDFYGKAHMHLDETERAIDTIKKKLFENYKSDVINTMSTASFTLIDMSYALRLHKVIFDALYGWSKNEKFVKLNNYQEKLENRIMFLQKIIRAYQATTESVLQNKSTDAIKTLSLMSFVVFPLSLIAAIFSMNTRDTPLVTEPSAFYEVVTIMLIVFVVMMIFFKKKKWL